MYGQVAQAFTLVSCVAFLGIMLNIDWVGLFLGKKLPGRFGYGARVVVGQSVFGLVYHLFYMVQIGQIERPSEAGLPWAARSLPLCSTWC